MTDISLWRHPNLPSKTHGTSLLTVLKASVRSINVMWNLDLFYGKNWVNCTAIRVEVTS